MQAKLVHINLIAKNWQRLTSFYIQVFDCIPVPPERDLSGEWLEKATGIANARLHGAHLRLPGYGANGPTLEIFEFETEEEKPFTAVNRPGYGHLAFSVDDVLAARESVLAAGGKEVGQPVKIEIHGAGVLEFVYVADPEGNVIELQRWL